MRLSLILIAILISACGRNYQDFEGAIAPQAVLNKVLTPEEREKAREIIPHIGSFLSIQEKLRLEDSFPKGTSGYSSTFHLNQYINSTEFNAKMGQRAESLARTYRIYFEPESTIMALTGKAYVGVCWRGSKIIILSSDFWSENSSEELWRDILVFHELGHCFLKRPHKENSIMQPVLIYPSEYKSKEDTYNKELFGM